MDKFLFFPPPDWKTLRLTPTFMIRFGAAAYPGLHDGALTTWIYGPVPLLLNLPATLAAGIVRAVLGHSSPGSRRKSDGVVCFRRMSCQ